jgi:DNA-binding IclR family transcriptional regulator
MGTPVNNSVARAFRLLEAFGAGEDELSGQELARRTGLAPATAHRFLLTLEQLGAVSRGPGGGFRLGMLLVDLAGRVARHKVLAAAAQAHVDALVAALRETVHVAVLEGEEVAYVAKGESDRSLQINTYVGKLLPAYCSGVGKVLLAGLDAAGLDRYFAAARLTPLTRHTITDRARLTRELKRVAARGHAVDDQETEEGLRCVAVPIIGRDGRVEAAISVAGPATRLDAAAMARARGLLASHAALIAATLHSGAALRPAAE